QRRESPDRRRPDPCQCVRGRVPARARGCAESAHKVICPRRHAKDAKNFVQRVTPNRREHSIYWTEDGGRQHSSSVFRLPSALVALCRTIEPQLALTLELSHHPANTHSMNKFYELITFASCGGGILAPSKNHNKEIRSIR